MEYYLSVREKKLILHGHEKKYDSIYVNFHNEQNCSVTMGVRVMATLEGAIKGIFWGAGNIVCFPLGGGYMGNTLSGTIRMCALPLLFSY